MNNCKFIRQDLDSYRDRTLEENRHEEVDLHLRNCSACSQEIDRATFMEQSLKEVSSDWSAPDLLWSRIKTSANTDSTQDVPTRKFQKQLPWALTALLLITLGFLGMNLVQDENEILANSVASSLVNEFHTFVVSQRKLDYPQTQPLEIRKWFGDKVNFRAPLPLQTPGFQLAGGRLCNMFEQRVASYMYQSDGAWISLYIMKLSADEAFRNGHKPETEITLQGYGYIDWEENGLRYSLVGDVSVDRLRQLAIALNATQAKLNADERRQLDLLALNTSQ
jgi:anti-sigma factor RsiW